MQNPFLLSPKARLANWRDFRKSLSEYDQKTQLDMVATYWSVAPLSKIAYNPDEPSAWPNPWEMISENDWCRSSVAIGMFVTLQLAGWNTENMELRLIIDRDNEDMMLVLIIDQTIVLNYDWGSVQDYPTTGIKTLNRYRWDGKKFIIT